MSGKKVGGIVCLGVAVALFINAYRMVAHDPNLLEESGLGLSRAVGAFLPAMVALILGFWLLKKAKGQGRRPTEKGEGQGTMGNGKPSHGFEATPSGDAQLGSAPFGNLEEGVRCKRTTVLGAVAIGLGGILVVAIFTRVLQALLAPNLLPDHSTHILLACGFALSVDGGLLLGGILVVARHRYARATLLVTLLVSIPYAVWFYVTQLPPQESTGNIAFDAGRAVGRVCGVSMVPACCVLLLCHLQTRRSLAEFKAQEHVRRRKGGGHCSPVRHLRVL